MRIKLVLIKKLVLSNGKQKGFLNANDTDLKRPQINTDKTKKMSLSWIYVFITIKRSGLNQLQMSNYELLEWFRNELALIRN